MERHKMKLRNAVLTLAVAATTTACATAQTTTQPHAHAARPHQSGLSVTIYSSADPSSFDPQQFIAQQRQGYNPNFAWQVPGFGVVKQERITNMGAGVNTLQFTDVAQFIDPSTVTFTDLTAPQATRVLEQQFQFDLVTPDKLLDKYLGQPVTALLPSEADGRERVAGTLLSATQGQLVIQTDAGVRMVPRDGETQVQLGELPGGLITKPTLAWLIQSDVAGQRKIRTTYETAGLTWMADYNLVLDANETKADLGAWVTLMNLSGVSYPDAKLKLIAGDVQRVQPRQPQPRMMYRQQVAEAAMAGFEEKAFFEYHLYTLPRTTTINQNSTQQITLFPTARGVNVKKTLVYYGLPQAASWGAFPKPNVDRNLGSQSNPKLDIYLQFKNSQANNLGMPLPSGKVRVFKEDPADGTLEFVGEDLIDHTPRDETLLIKLGQAFDIVGERTQTDFTIDQRNHVITESYRIDLRNHKDEAVEVLVKENLFRWSNWQITNASDNYEKVDARTVHFPVTVPAHGEKSVTYTVRYTW